MGNATSQKFQAYLDKYAAQYMGGGRAGSTGYQNYIKQYAGNYTGGGKMFQGDFMKMYAGTNTGGGIMSLKQYMKMYAGKYMSGANHSPAYESYIDQFARKFVTKFMSSKTDGSEKSGGSAQDYQNYINKFDPLMVHDQPTKPTKSPEEIKLERETLLKKVCLWRQTGGCSTDGSNREPDSDLPCTSPVPKDASGFCDCDGDGKMEQSEFGYGCNLSPGTCLHVCLADAAMQDAAIPFAIPRSLFLFLVTGLSLPAAMGLVRFFSRRDRHNNGEEADQEGGREYQSFM